MKTGKIMLNTALTALMAFGTVQSTSAMMDPEFKSMTQSRLGVVATQLKARAKTADETTILNNMDAEFSPIFKKDNVNTILGIRTEIETTAHNWVKGLRVNGGDAVFTAHATGLLGRANAFVVNNAARIYVASPADDQRNTLRTAIKAQITASIVPAIVFPATPITKANFYQIERLVRTQIVDDAVENFARHLSANLGDHVLDGNVVTVDALLATVPAGGVAVGDPIPGALHGETYAAILNQANAQDVIQRRNNAGITHYPQDDTLAEFLTVLRSVLMGY